MLRPHTEKDLIVSYGSLACMVQKSTVPSAHRISPLESRVNPKEKVFAEPVLDGRVKVRMEIERIQQGSGLQKLHDT